MSKVLNFFRALLSRGVPAREIAHQPEIVWEPVEFSFAVDWYLIGGEDYLRRINVPASVPEMGPSSVAFTDLVKETSRKLPPYCSEHAPRSDQSESLPLWGISQTGRGVCELCRREGRFRRNA